jgi:hypothetical protein
LSRYRQLDVLFRVFLQRCPDFSRHKASRIRYHPPRVDV